MATRQVFPKPAAPVRHSHVRSDGTSRAAIQTMLKEYDATERPFNPEAPVARPRNHVYVNNGSRRGGIADLETLTECLEMELESMDVQPRQARDISRVDKATMDAARRYEDAVDTVLLDYLQRNIKKFNLGRGPLADAHDEFDVLQVLSELGGGASYLYYMEAGGSGIGTWDGRWDGVFKSDKDLEALRKLVKKETASEYQALETAIMNCASELMEEHGIEGFEANASKKKAPKRARATKARKGSGDQYFAQPYADVEGFYFTNMDEFEAGMKKLARRRVEEVEIQFIDGDEADTDLFNELKIGQGNIDKWFDEIQPLSEVEKAGIYGINDAGGRDLDEMIRQVQQENPIVFEGTVLEYAENYVDDIGGPKNLGKNQSGQSYAEQYFDYDKFGQSIKNDILTSSDDEEEQERVEGMSDREVGEEFVESVGWDGIGEAALKEFFDYEYFARDMQLSGAVSEQKFGGKTWVYDNNIV